MTTDELIAKCRIHVTRNDMLIATLRSPRMHGFVLATQLLRALSEPPATLRHTTDKAR